MECRWHPDIDALSFRPREHEGRGFVHRRALQTLLGGVPVSAEACENYFLGRLAAFQSAAVAKIARDRLGPTANFHLNSRDIKRALSGETA
jgi:hypothetical protein